MRCFSEIQVKNKKGQLIPVPCGRCYACLARKRMDWVFRLKQEQKNSLYNEFLTLTYADEYLPYGVTEPSLLKRDLQNFMKSLRKEQTKVSEQKIRYYAVGEYGDKFKRPHYHLILFNLLPIISERSELIWKKGTAHTETISDLVLNYVAGYVFKRSYFPTGSEKPFAVMSRKPGIGHSYVKEQMEYHQKGKFFHVVNEGGRKQIIPNYYKKKLFTESEIKSNTRKLLKQSQQMERDEEKRLTLLGNNPVRYKHDLKQQITKTQKRKLKDKV